MCTACDTSRLFTSGNLYPDTFMLLRTLTPQPFSRLTVNKHGASQISASDAMDWSHSFLNHVFAGEDLIITAAARSSCGVRSPRCCAGCPSL